MLGWGLCLSMEVEGPDQQPADADEDDSDVILELDEPDGAPKQAPEALVRMFPLTPRNLAQETIMAC